MELVKIQGKRSGLESTENQHESACCTRRSFPRHTLLLRPSPRPFTFTRADNQTRTEADASHVPLRLAWAYGGKKMSERGTPKSGAHFSCSFIFEPQKSTWSVQISQPPQPSSF